MSPWIWAIGSVVVAVLELVALNQRGLEMVGARGKVIEVLANGHGKVELGDSVWLAEGPDLVLGSPVVVTSVRGTVVIVAPL